MVDFTKVPLLMGVVNVTPDSFSDGGDFLDSKSAIDHALKLWEEGADVLDIGGESTRPNAIPVSVEEEQNRILPVIEGIKKAQPQAIISVDTRNADTMQRVIDLGVDIINDVSALTHDPHSMFMIVKAQITVILMHMKGTPQTMQAAPHYDDVVDEIFHFLQTRISACVKAGINRKNIICDPGIGFGKTLDDNLKILGNLDRFHDLNCSILLGASRKSFIEKLCPNTPADQRLAGSITAAIKGLEQNIQLFRVHDVAQTKQAFTVWQSIQSA